MKTLTIGKLAQQSKVTIETIRYYQRIGILEEPIKPIKGYRQYPIEMIARIHFIKRAQQTGFTLKEISELLAIKNSQCTEVRKLAEHKRQQIDHQINNLTTLRNGLDNLIRGCHDTPSVEHCSLIDTLSKKPS